MFDPLTQGFLLGFVVSMPIGPIGLLCIQRSLSHGWLRGMSAGFGATAADLIYACLLGFGITFINDFLTEWAAWLRLPAAALLLFLGYRAFRSPAVEGDAASAGTSARATAAATFSLMISNPLTLVGFTAVFAALGGATRITGTVSAVVLIAGVALGCLLWWSLLAGAAALLRKRFRPAALVWINRITGVGLAAFGLWLLVKSILAGLT
jgi:threonine/homoserine/homoserine lactone efflux protein